MEIFVKFFNQTYYLGIIPREALLSIFIWIPKKPKINLVLRLVRYYVFTTLLFGDAEIFKKNSNHLSLRYKKILKILQTTKL